MSYTAYHLNNLAQFTLPTAVPTILCLVLLIMQLCQLRKACADNPANPANRSGDREVDNCVSKASWTIFLLTSIYVSTSAVSVITWLVSEGRKGYLFSRIQRNSLVLKERRAMPDMSEHTAIYFSLLTCTLICSTLTPLTLLLRRSCRAR